MTDTDSLTLGGIRSLLGTLAGNFFIDQPDPRTQAYSAQQLQELWYPPLVGAREQLIDTPLGLVNVTVGGKADGPALLLWPSLMLRGSMWNAQYNHFRDRHLVVLIDSPGIGKSDDLREAPTLKQCSDVVVSILDALHIRKCLFAGNSWGANLAAVLPAWIPDRLYGTMVINGTASKPTFEEYLKMMARCSVLMCCSKVPAWWVPTATAAFAGDSATKNNPEFLAYIGVIRHEDPKSIAYALQGILLNRTDRHRLLSTIKDIPVLVVAGEEDREFKVPVVKALADSLPTSRFVIAPKTAHLASRENPQIINPIMDDFIRSLDIKA